MLRRAKDNPYTLYFGKEPAQMIARLTEYDEICDSFLAENPSQLLYMITGVRGSGKTVLMTEIQKDISKQDDWIAIELNPAKDMLTSLAAKLYNHVKISEIIRKAKINLSFFGIGMSIDSADPITDIETAISRMLAEIKKYGKRVLITVDEASSTEYMRIFASSFQIFIRQDMPVFLIMTGLFENIDALQNDKILTFLFRAPKIRLKPLNIGRMAANYERTLGVTSDEAREMAQMTMGYPFAYQVLGYYTFENNGDYRSAIPAFRQQLDEYVYDKIWSELSKKDKEILFALSNSEDGRVTDIRDTLGMKTNEFGTYRNRLVKKGVINGDEYGYITFSLPMFKEYVKDNYY